MVVRHERKSRKLLGSRRWGMGNIKNARGKGDRGGVGNAGFRKHKFTYVTAKTPWLISRKGFTSKKKNVLKEINLRDISKNFEKGNYAKEVVELRNYKVLGNGELSVPMEIKAAAFSKKAEEKIAKIGGKAVVLR
ncbi:MAG: uL15m family ribosomal protein [Candidatus Micrarchaeia archaeon]